MDDLQIQNFGRVHKFLRKLQILCEIYINETLRKSDEFKDKKIYNCTIPKYRVGTKRIHAECNIRLSSGPNPIIITRRFNFLLEQFNGDLDSIISKYYTNYDKDKDCTRVIWVTG